MEKKLQDILSQIPVKWEATGSVNEARVGSVEYDSRSVKVSSIFVALSGQNVDGHRYIRQAVKNGATAVFGSQPAENWVDLAVPYLQVEDTREALAYLSAAFYDFPARSMVMIGVTGTDGKTTTSNLLYQILKTAGIKVGMISTVNAQIGDQVLDTGFHVTTPEAPAVQLYLQRMREAGMTHVILETTSHGLAQKRVLGCEFDIGVVTNITHEHLDFHGSYEEYRAAKARLFTMLAETQVKAAGNIRLAVINLDDISFSYLNETIKTPRIVYSTGVKSDLWAEEIKNTADGIQFMACSQTFRQEVTCRIPGEFNVANSLAAMAAAIYGLGISEKVAAQGIGTLESVPGRMQPINMGQTFQAIVDFAHTPNALEKALKTARKMTDGQVIAVFGSAGLRDRDKRRLMAAVSAQFADVTILTAEDPRTEDLGAILAEMQKEAELNGAKVGQDLFVVADRGEAIELGLRIAKDGDLVMACGKGHEQSMCFGEVEYDWDDRVAMQAGLARLLGVEGPEMPYLPTRGRS